MRFKHESIPQFGTHRITRKFLWSPLTIGDETRWLERVTYIERYAVQGWVRTKWVDSRVDVPSPMLGEYDKLDQ